MIYGSPEYEKLAAKVIDNNKGSGGTSGHLAEDVVASSGGHLTKGGWNMKSARDADAHPRLVRLRPGRK
jgi:hypothetical protein